MKKLFKLFFFLHYFKKKIFTALLRFYTIQCICLCYELDKSKKLTKRESDFSMQPSYGHQSSFMSSAEDMDKERGNWEEQALKQIKDAKNRPLDEHEDPMIAMKHKTLQEVFFFLKQSSLGMHGKE